MSSVDDFPITNSSRIKIIHLPNDKFIIARANFYNKQAINYEPLMGTLCFDSVAETEHLIHEIYIELLGMPKSIMQLESSNLLEHDSFVQGVKDVS
jgi:hypothetical protein